MKCYELIRNAFSHPPWLAWRWRTSGAGNAGLKLSLGRRRGWSEDVLVFYFVSHHPTHFFSGNKLN